MPQFWKLTHRKHHQSLSTIRKPDPDISAIVLKVREIDSRGNRDRNVQVVHQSLHCPTIPPSIPVEPPASDVAIVGAGPAGLMLSTNLIRFGINVDVIDNRADKTATGRADGLQPKTLETLRQMRLIDRLLLKGVKVHDVRFWNATEEQPLRRIARDVFFPNAQIDTLDPYLLLAHEGFIEDLFIKDMMERGAEVQRNLTFVDYNVHPDTGRPIEIICKGNTNHTRKVFLSKYLIGCDGAHSTVRKAMGSRAVGVTSCTDSLWAVIDGVLETDFPDLYSKVVIHSDLAGTILLFPRERNMTRMYVELKWEWEAVHSKDEILRELVLDRVEEIFEPYSIKWKSIDWFGFYQIGQKIASRFQDESNKVFIAGDATHTNSPKASQGMNTSLHDSWNLAWKLNLAIRGIAKPALLNTYEEERRQVAEDLVDFDSEYSSVMLAGDPEALIDNFRRNVRFVSGFGADYAPNVLNVPQKGTILGDLRVGSIPPPAKVTRYIDSNPVDIQLDIPMLGQFRILVFTKSLTQPLEFLEVLSSHALSFSSVMGKATCAANASYTAQPPFAAVSDEFIRPERYTPLSGIFTFGIVLQMGAHELELDDLPPVWRESRFTVYLDDVPHLDTRRVTCTEKWLGNISGSECGVVVLRPDGYVGTIWRSRGTREHAARACKHLDSYFSGFLNVNF